MTLFWIIVAAVIVRALFLKPKDALPVDAKASIPNPLQSGGPAAARGGEAPALGGADVAARRPHTDRPGRGQPAQRDPYSVFPRKPLSPLPILTPLAQSGAHAPVSPLAARAPLKGLEFTGQRGERTWHGRR